MMPERALSTRRRRWSKDVPGSEESERGEACRHAENMRIVSAADLVRPISSRMPGGEPFACRM
jgi:hypothetical protein